MHFDERYIVIGFLKIQINVSVWLHIRPFEHLYKYSDQIVSTDCRVMHSFVFLSAGVSLDLSQPAAALQSQKAQASALPLIQSQTNSNQAAAPQKQVH